MARRFAAGGFHVALMSRSLERVEALAQQIVKEGNKATAVPVDVTNAQAVKTAFATVREQLGDPAVLVRDQCRPMSKIGWQKFIQDCMWAHSPFLGGRLWVGPSAPPQRYPQPPVQFADVGPRHLLRDLLMPAFFFGRCTTPTPPSLGPLPNSWTSHRNDLRVRLPRRPQGPSMLLKR